MSARLRSTEDGSYELLSHLASGGMAELFLARRSKDGADAPLVVLKRILPAHVRNQDFVSMFLDEARLSSRLNHVNIARVLEVGRLADTYFYTMEYVRGKNAREVLARAATTRTRITPTLAVSILVDVATGLHAAHDQRDLRGQPLEIVHRDVSPANVMIGFDGMVKIVDFGVAKAADRMTHTQSGTIKGKTAYLSPEQCRGKAIDRRSDIFSLGIVAWELLTQRRLFRYDNDYDTMDAIMQGRIAPPSEISADVPRAIDAVIARALARVPAERFATAAEFATALITALGRPRASDATAQLAGFMASLFGEPTTLPVATLAATLGALDVSVIGDDDREDDTSRLDPTFDAETDHGILQASPEAIQSPPVTPAPPRVAPRPPTFAPGRTLPLGSGAVGPVPRRAISSPIVTSPAAIGSATLSAATVPPPARAAAAPTVPPRPVAAVSPAAIPTASVAIISAPVAIISAPVASTSASAPVEVTNPPIARTSARPTRPPGRRRGALAGGVVMIAALTAAALIALGRGRDTPTVAAGANVVPPASAVAAPASEDESKGFAAAPVPRTATTAEGEAVRIEPELTLTRADIEADVEIEPTQVETARVKTARVKAARVEAARVEAARVEAARVEPTVPTVPTVPRTAFVEPATTQPTGGSGVTAATEATAAAVPRPAAESLRTARKRTADEVRTHVREAISRDAWTEALSRCKQAAAEQQPAAVCGFAACMSGLTNTAVYYASRLTDQQRRSLEKACAARNHPISGCEDPTRCRDAL